MTSTEYADLIQFLGLGFLIRDRMEPELRARWNAELHRAIGMRGGLSEDGEHVVVDIGRDVLSEVAEVGVRFYAGELTTGLHDHQHIDEDSIQRVEAELSHALAKVLAHIETAKL